MTGRISDSTITDFYGKLTDLAFQKEPGDSFAVLARFILEHFEKVPELPQTVLSMKCSVSPATVSRFIRLTGAESYGEFRELVQATIPRIPILFEWSHPVRDIPFRQPYGQKEIDECLDRTRKEISGAFNAANLSQIENMAADMSQYKSVYLMGNRHMQTIFQHLVNEMAPLGKTLHLISDPSEIFTPREDSLLLVFSMYGMLLDEAHSKVLKLAQQKAGQIYIITQVAASGPFPCVNLGKCSTSTTDYLVWMLMAEQLIYDFLYINQLIDDL